MKLSNSIKLAMANFSLFWKVLVYKILSVGIIALLVLPVLGILISCLESVGFFNTLNSFVSASFFQNLTEMFEVLFLCVKSFIKGVFVLAQIAPLAFSYLLFVLFFVAPFILKLSDIPTSECVYGYMSSLNRNSFTLNFIDNLGRSTVYSALKSIMEIPFWFIVAFGMYGILSLTTLGFTMQVLCPLLLFAFAIFMVDVKITFFSGWVPSIVVFNAKVVKAFNKGIVAVKRKFLSTLSSFAVVAIVMFAIIYMFGLYSLIVVVPLYALINSVFGQVLFFESQGMNYYLTPDNIIMPRKLEQADSIKKVKNII